MGQYQVSTAQDVVQEIIREKWCRSEIVGKDVDFVHGKYLLVHIDSADWGHVPVFHIMVISGREGSIPVSYFLHTAVF
jgi:hypothetical protein